MPQVCPVGGKAHEPLHKLGSVTLQDQVTNPIPLISMSKVYDRNQSFLGEDIHLSFYLKFDVTEQYALVFNIEIYDSKGKVILKSSNASGIDSYHLEKYRNWNPKIELELFIEMYEKGDIKNESIWFYEPFCNNSIEIMGPNISSNIYTVNINLPRAIILEQYTIEDSGVISVSFLCKREDLLNHFRELQMNLLKCLSSINSALGINVNIERIITNDTISS